MPSATERLRVLLVEDDRDLAEVTQAALEFEGLEVAVAYDGREGLEAAFRLRPDVIITDLIMPVLDGLQLIQRLQSEPEPRSPVIAVSAVSSRLRTARELGAVEGLVKPVHPRELADCARKAWRHAHAA
jgi:two-component system response regulator MtrA